MKKLTQHWDWPNARSSDAVWARHVPTLFWMFSEDADSVMSEIGDPMNGLAAPLIGVSDTVPAPGL
jgi:hypothetical protein